MKKLYLKTKINKFLDEYYYRNKLSGTLPSKLDKTEQISFITNNLIDIQDLQYEIYNNFKILNNKIQIPHIVEFVLSILLQHSSNSYLVGGCVRDCLLDITPKDYDFVTDLSYEKLQEIFKDYKFKETGQQFLVFNLVIDNIEYEIANFRKENTYLDGRRPSEVNIGTLEDDMDRRDFTVNALYWNSITGIVGSVQSIDDILSKTLRFIGKPVDRLEEDYLRGWRFYRLLKTKKLKADNKSLRAVRTHFNKLMKCDSQRVMNEIEKICL